MNRLQHYLVRADEETHELGQRITKALVFGLDEIQKGQELNNKQRIIYELNDLFAILELTFDCPIEYLIDSYMIDLKKIKVEEYLQYCKSIGTLNDE